MALSIHSRPSPFPSMLIPLAAISVLASGVTPGAVHCEVPCGIYGDHLRLELLEEHAATIEKAMKEIESLSAEAEPNMNQIVRWTMTKEQHAQVVQDQTSGYWLAQRIKEPTMPVRSPDYGPAKERYVAELVFCHRIITEAMACKQTTDAAKVANLREAVKCLRVAHMGEEEQKHLAEGHGHSRDTPPALDQETRRKVGVCKASLRVLSDALTEFALNNGRLPSELEVLVMKDENGASYIRAEEMPKDPWGFDFIFEPVGDTLEFRVISYGSDGRPGGTGSAADLVSGSGKDE